MPVYEYTALNPKGKHAKGIIDADSAALARQKLRASRLYPVDIKSVDRQRGDHTDSAPRRAGKGLLSRIRAVDVTVMTRQLATLVGAGFPLVTAIDSIQGQIKSRPFKKLLAQVKNQIVEGSSFAGALSRYPGTFSPLYINMVRAGESSGTLEIILDRLADIAEKQHELKSRIKTAMTYPVLMAVVGALVLFVLLAHIIPGITAIFKEMGQALPAPTRALMAVSGTLQQYWWMLILLLVAAAILFRLAVGTAKGRKAWDRARLMLPIVGHIHKRLAVARLSRTLGSLLENGVSMITALDIVRNIVGNVVMADAVSAASVEVESGSGLADALSASAVFPLMFIQMVQVGEQSGELEQMLTRTADVFEREAAASISQITALLEPIMILLMAVVVGAIVISVCLPIFEMHELIR